MAFSLSTDESVNACLIYYSTRGTIADNYPSIIAAVRSPRRHLLRRLHGEMNDILPIAAKALGKTVNKYLHGCIPSDNSATGSATHGPHAIPQVQRFSHGREAKRSCANRDFTGRT